MAMEIFTVGRGQEVVSYTHLYYGDEIGMRYVEGLKSVEGGYNRTGSRSPMQRCV